MGRPRKRFCATAYITADILRECETPALPLGAVIYEAGSGLAYVDFPTDCINRP
jgi:hypothetical protein